MIIGDGRVQFLTPGRQFTRHRLLGRDAVDCPDPPPLASKINGNGSLRPFAPPQRAFGESCGTIFEQDFKPAGIPQHALEELPRLGAAQTALGGDDHDADDVPYHVPELDHEGCRLAPIGPFWSLLTSLKETFEGAP